MTACFKSHSKVSHLKNMIFDIADFNACVFTTRSVCQKHFKPWELEKERSGRKDKSVWCFISAFNTVNSPEGTHSEPWITVQEWVCFKIHHIVLREYFSQRTLYQQHIEWCVISLLPLYDRIDWLSSMQHDMWGWKWTSFQGPRGGGRKKKWLYGSAGRNVQHWYHISTTYGHSVLHVCSLLYELVFSY